MHTGLGFGTLPTRHVPNIRGINRQRDNATPNCSPQDHRRGPGPPCSRSNNGRTYPGGAICGPGGTTPRKRPRTSRHQQASRFADPVQPKRLIPDLGTWVQCFSLYTAVLLTKHPHRATSLMLYQKNIGYLSQRFRWPTWVLYDYSFRQEAADLGKIDWSQLDYGLHAKYFHHINSSLDAWCSICHSGEHRQGNCPLTNQKQPSPGEPIRKRQNTSQSPAPKRPLPERSLPPICQNFNFGNGVCRFGPRCSFVHVCWRCQGPHPMTRCRRQGSNPQQGYHN